MNVLDVYRQLLPGSNCSECGLPTCLAFASAVVVEGRDVSDCPYVTEKGAQLYASSLAEAGEEAGTRRDLAQDALNWARQRASSMAIVDMPVRIGGVLEEGPDGPVLTLPYFTGEVRISDAGIRDAHGAQLNVWERVLLYNHMAQGGSSEPSGRWIGLEQIPNSTSKVKSLRGVAEDPISQRFDGRLDDLSTRAAALGGRDASSEHPSPDLALSFRPLPRVPLLLLFWDGDEAEGFSAKAKILYDSTVEDHLDIESIVFLTERLAQLLCGRD